MPSDTGSKGFSRRVAALTPEKRVALQRWLVQTAPGSDSPAGEKIPIQPRGEQRDFPLSSAQERMWFNHQWSPDKPIYNESFGLSIRGALQPDLLEQSFNFVMARHEIFTVTLHSDQGRLFQRLNGAPRPRMEVHDLRGLDAAGREAAYETQSRRLLREPFCLDRGPLFRGGLWTIGDGAYRVIFVMHHIIFDGWSGAIFFRELFTSYAALVAGHQPDLPPLGAQYVDFAAWEQSHFERTAASFDRQLDYWKKQLTGAVPPQLPFDHHASTARAHAAGREVFVCPVQSFEGLKELAREEGATLFMALLAIFNLLLSRYTGQDDIVVGLPTTNRNQSALRDIVGVFINTVLLRTDLSSTDLSGAGVPRGVTFRELLDRVRIVTLNAQANQEVPLQSLIRNLDLHGNSGRSLVSVLFDFQKKSSSFDGPTDVVIESMDACSGMAKCDLVLAMEDRDSELVGALDYDAEQFDTATARQMVRHFLVLMNLAVAQPDIPIGKLPILSREESAQAEVRGLDTSDQPHPFPCAETIARATERPESLALSDEHDTLTFGELRARSVRLGGGLRRHGVGAGQHVALFLPAGADLVIAQLAVMLAGAAFVPIDPAYPDARVEFMIRDCEAKFVIVNNSSPRTPPGTAQIVRMEGNTDSIDAELAKASDKLGSDCAYVIYTSGSTGAPKGVSVSYGAVANLIAWHQRAFQVTCDDRASQVASISFDASIWEIWPYLSVGASVHFAPRGLIANAHGMRDWLVKNKITVSFAPTPLAEELIELRWPSKGTLRYLLTGGDRLRKSPPHPLPSQFINNYGPTENAVVSTSGPVAPTQVGSTPSIGRPIDNVWLRIVDRNLEDVPHGVNGELVVGGCSLASGYWNQPALTADRFVILANGHRAYRTGDICRVRRDGEIEFIGRQDTQVKLRGCRIELGEIESALLAFDGVRQAAVCVWELPSGRPGIVAYLVSEAPLALDTLRTFLSDRLPGYMMPVCFEQLEALPQTPNGKLDRTKLPEPEFDSPRAGEPAIEPRTTTESRIADIWKKLLKIHIVSVQDGFFQLGGDSMLATRFAVTVRERFGVELPLALMMSTPTVEAIAAYVDSARPHREQLPRCLISLRSGSDSLPPLFLAPPASGSPACYITLAMSLPSDRTVYGFEASGLTAGRLIASVEMQAHQYAEALKTVYPEGPCFLAGWSLGGPVAFEVACQLREEGREVAYLALIDAGLPENGRLPGGASMLTPLWWAISYPFVEHLPLSYETLRALCRFVGIVLPESLSSVWRRGPLAGVQFATGLFSSGWRSLGVFLASLRGFHRFRPRPFDGSVTLFRTAQGGTMEKGKEALLSNIQQWSRDVKVHDVLGSHMTLMLDPKISSAFAPSLEATFHAASRAAGVGK